MPLFGKKSKKTKEVVPIVGRYIKRETSPFIRSECYEMWIMYSWLVWHHSNYYSDNQNAHIIRHGPTLQRRSQSALNISTLGTSLPPSTPLLPSNPRPVFPSAQQLSSAVASSPPSNNFSNNNHSTTFAKDSNGAQVSKNLQSSTPNIAYLSQQQRLAGSMPSIPGMSRNMPQFSSTTHIYTNSNNVSTTPPHQPNISDPRNTRLIHSQSSVTSQQMNRPHATTRLAQAGGHLGSNQSLLPSRPQITTSMPGDHPNLSKQSPSTLFISQALTKHDRSSNNLDHISEHRLSGNSLHLRSSPNIVAQMNFADRIGPGEGRGLSQSQVNLRLSRESLHHMGQQPTAYLQPEKYHNNGSPERKQFLPFQPQQPNITHHHPLKMKNNMAVSNPHLFVQSTRYTDNMVVLSKDYVIDWLWEVLPGMVRFWIFSFRILSNKNLQYIEVCYRNWNSCGWGQTLYFCYCSVGYIHAISTGLNQLEVLVRILSEALTVVQFYMFMLLSNWAYIVKSSCSWILNSWLWIIFA